jgi:hypothetical protein
LPCCKRGFDPRCPLKEILHLPVCKNCNSEFPNWERIDGVLKSLSRRKYCLKCSSFGSHNTRNPATRPFLKYTKEVLEKAVSESKNMVEAIGKLGIKPGGRNHSYISSRVRQFGIDTSHFVKRARGFSSNTRGVLRIWKESDHRRYRVNVIRDAMLRSGVPHTCSSCGCPPE